MPRVTSATDPNPRRDDRAYLKRYVRKEQRRERVGAAVTLRAGARKPPRFVARQLRIYGYMLLPRASPDGFLTSSVGQAYLRMSSKCPNFRFAVLLPSSRFVTL